MTKRQVLKPKIEVRTDPKDEHVWLIDAANGCCTLVKLSFPHSVGPVTRDKLRYEILHAVQNVADDRFNNFIAEYARK